MSVINVESERVSRPEELQHLVSKRAKDRLVKRKDRTSVGQVCWSKQVFSFWFNGAPAGLYYPPFFLWDLLLLSRLLSESAWPL